MAISRWRGQAREDSEMRPFRELRVVQTAHTLVFAVYGETRTFPREELFGLTSQVRRSAASIPTNIAEGSARSDQEFHHFLRIALGSAAELEYQLYLARDLGYIPSERYELLNTDLMSVKGMLVQFMKRVRIDQPPRQRPMANGQPPEAHA